jgi:N-acyl-D-aspartate/D-glutamate deacylase
VPEPEDDGQRAPASLGRRRLLIAGGLGAVSWVVLRNAPDRPKTVQEAAAAPTPTTTTVTVREAAQPPALEGAAPNPAADHTFDLVLLNGRVVDPESGFDQVAHVGIDGDTITAISTDTDTLLKGGQTVDARGLVVSPGFIDILSYEPNDYGVWYKIADGVTTNLGMHGINSTADDFHAAYQGRVPVHFGGAFDDPYMRGTFTGLGDGTAALPYQLDQLADLARAGFESGWLGLDLEPEYTPGVGPEEISRLTQVAAEYGRPAFFHARYSEPDKNLLGIDEIIQVARDTGIAVHVDHITSTGGTFTMGDTLARIEAARDEGLDVTACLYPYDFWATYIQSARLGPDPTTGESVINRYGIHWSDLVVAGTGEVLTEERYNQLRSSGSSADNLLVAALGTIPEEEINMALQTEWTMIGSDAIPEPGDNNHPRASGCFARALGRYARHRGVLSLDAALAKMTILPAKRLEASAPVMKKKGRLQRGAHADITIFDPDTILDTSTLDNPASESAGISYVLVMGQLVLDPSGPKKDVLPGQAITA